MNKTCCVITTIHGPDHGSIREWIAYWAARDSTVIIVPDRKTPLHEWVDSVDPPDSINEVKDRYKTDPVVIVMPQSTLIDQSWAVDNSYSRKSIGYLAALRLGFEYVFETDDDNYPLPGVEYEPVEPQKVVDAIHWNAYDYFAPGQHLVPRGLPLMPPIRSWMYDINDPKMLRRQPRIWLWMCNGVPDVWACQHPLLNKDVVFEDKPPVALNRGCYAPINSQHTLWHLPTMVRHMYIPCTCRQRETDILRGNIALYNTWAENGTAVFCGPGVYQQRNEHDYIWDMDNEWRMHTEINYSDNLYNLIEKGICDSTEMERWIKYQQLCTEYQS